MTRFKGFISLSDIQKENIYTGENGKKFLSITIGERKEPSAKGYTHYIKVSVKPEEQKDGVNYYIGSLKPSQFQDTQKSSATPDATANAEPDMFPPAESDGLPF